MSSAFTVPVYALSGHQYIAGRWVSGTGLRRNVVDSMDDAHACGGQG